MSLPTIESSYATHTTKGISGFDNPEYPAIRVALEVLNATESYLWVYICNFNFFARSLIICSAISEDLDWLMVHMHLWTLKLEFSISLSIE